MSDAEIVRENLESLRWAYDTPEGHSESVALAEAALERLESQNQALQEGAEKAEARLRGHETCECGHTLCQHEPRSFGCADLHGPCALSPTQETDPE